MYELISGAGEVILKGSESNQNKSFIWFILYKKRIYRELFYESYFFPLLENSEKLINGGVGDPNKEWGGESPKTVTEGLQFIWNLRVQAMAKLPSKSFPVQRHWFQFYCWLESQSTGHH